MPLVSRVCRLVVTPFLLLVCLQPLYAQQKRAVTFTDLMQFQTIQQPVLSDNGAWVAYTAAPDRGDGEAVVQATRSETRYVLPLGSNPILSADGQWAAVRLNPPMAAVEAANGENDKPRPGLALLNTATGNITEVAEVQAFSFSDDGRYLAYHHHEARVEKDSTAADAGKPKGKRKAGTHLVLHALATGTETAVEYVRAYAFDKKGRYLAYSVAAPDHGRDGLYVRDLSAPGVPERALDARAAGHYSSLAWDEEGGRLAFLKATEDEDGKPGEAALWLWDGTAAREAVADAPEGWRIPAANTLHWTRDGQRLFFGYRPVEVQKEEAEKDTTAAFDAYDVDAILADRTVDVWHTDDPRINTNQKRVWKQEQARTYEAVYHLDTGRAVALADLTVQGSGAVENERVMLGQADGPYLREITWDGRFFDGYVLDLVDGRKTRFAERLGSTVDLSPGGRYAVYYAERHWHLYDIAAGTTRSLTGTLGVPFGNEDHDFPSDVPGYGLGGWVEDDAAVLIYDKYDIWYVPTGGDLPSNLTSGEGRKQDRTFRLIRTDPDRKFYRAGETVLLSSYHNLKKNDGFYEVRLKAGPQPVRRLLEEEKRFRFRAKAKDADVYLYTREDYNEFPDLWVSDPTFNPPRRVTNLNRQLEPFAWGTSELMAWHSVDGLPLQGVVIKPENYDPNKRYPVLVYFYRFMSDRLHAFNPPVVNHRPSFPLYASNDYIVFLPDVRFEIGRPGFSATKCIVPGVQKLVDLGLADPDALGLHGHSWSGYQTAFMVTQTDLFKAAIAGAPVSNMTSAYGGIRWRTGLARQFQYEKTQSRLGTDLWDGRDRYIDNSPLFFADRIQTPLLILHGDDDGAVPWYQSIELYLALRRLGKEAVFLQYRGEDHHPATYANKLDWAMKMKEYFDHYLKGMPAPEWITKGVPYAGE